MLMCIPANEYRERLRRNYPAHPFIWYDSIEQYCEQEIVAPLVDLNLQLRCTIDAYASKNTLCHDKRWVRLIKETFHYSSKTHTPDRFGIPDRRNPLKKRHVSGDSVVGDHNKILTQADIAWRIYWLCDAIVPLPNLRNTEEVLGCINVLQKSILEEDPELPNFNAGFANLHRNDSKIEEKAWSFSTDKQRALDEQYATFKAQIQVYGHPSDGVLRRM